MTGFLTLVRSGALVAAASAALLFGAPNVASAHKGHHGHGHHGHGHHGHGHHGHGHHGHGHHGHRHHGHWRRFYTYSDVHCRRVCVGYLYWHDGHAHCDGYWRRRCHWHY